MSREYYSLRLSVSFPASTIIPHPIECQSTIVIQPQPSIRSTTPQVQKIVSPTLTSSHPNHHHVFTNTHQSCPTSSSPHNPIPSSIHDNYPRHGRRRYWSTAQRPRPRVCSEAPESSICIHSGGKSPLTDNCLHRDAFQKREKANEDYAIKQREKEKLLELKRKLADQQQHLKKLEESM
jgi:hypothetical protein